MAYSRIKLGAELLVLLEDNASVDLISHWADKVFSANINELDDFSIKALHSLSAMSLGNEFEYSNEDLKKFAKSIINENTTEDLDDFVNTKCPPS